MCRETVEPAVLSSPRQKLTHYIRIQGECVEYSHGLNYSRREGGDMRGVVGPFSRASRMRMLKLISQIDWSSVGPSLFVTLTYPDEVADLTYPARTKHRYLFMRYVEKHVGRRVPALWRVEWMKRRSGARVGEIMPHLHLLLGGVEYVYHRTVRKWWRTIVHVNNALCTDVQQIKAGEHAAFYVAKYQSKFASLDVGAYLNNENASGRHWGVLRKDLFSWHPIAALREITTEQAAQIRTMAAEHCRHYDPVLGGSVTIFGRDVAKVFEEKCQTWG